MFTVVALEFLGLGLPEAEQQLDLGVVEYVHVLVVLLVPILPWEDEEALEHTLARVIVLVIPVGLLDLFLLLTLRLQQVGVLPRLLGGLGQTEVLLLVVLGRLSGGDEFRPFLQSE